MVEGECPLRGLFGRRDALVPRHQPLAYQQVQSVRKTRLRGGIHGVECYGPLEQIRGTLELLGLPSVHEIQGLDVELEGLRINCGNLRWDSLLARFEKGSYAAAHVAGHAVP